MIPHEFSDERRLLVFHRDEGDRRLGARQRDVKQPPFLRIFKGIATGHGQLQHRIVDNSTRKCECFGSQARDDDVIGFQPFRCMCSGELDGHVLVVLERQVLSFFVVASQYEDAGTLALTGCTKLLNTSRYGLADRPFIGDLDNSNELAHIGPDRSDDLADLPWILLDELATDVAEGLRASIGALKP